MILPESPDFALCGACDETHRRRHRPLYYGIQYNHGGRFSLAVGEGPRLFYSGAWAFITHPGAFFDYELLDGGPHAYRYICVTPESAAPYAACGMLPAGAPPVRIRDAERFSAAMDDAIRLIRSGVPANYRRAVWRFEDLLLQLGEQERPQQEPRVSLRLERLCDAIRREPAREFDFRREADAMQVTLRHFRRLFRQYAGAPPQQFVLQNRLAYAADLLLMGGDRISEVAERAGFPGLFYFSALFKSRFGLSPSAYRREFQSDREVR